MSAKCSPYMYGATYIFYFVLPTVKTVEMMVQRVDFERNLKNICPATVTPSVTVLSHSPGGNQPTGPMDKA